MIFSSKMQKKVLFLQKFLIILCLSTKIKYQNKLKKKRFFLSQTQFNKLISVLARFNSIWIPGWALQIILCVFTVDDVVKRHGNDATIELSAFAIKLGNASLWGFIDDGCPLGVISNRQHEGVRDASCTDGGCSRRSVFIRVCNQCAKSIQAAWQNTASFAIMAFVGAFLQANVVLPSPNDWKKYINICTLKNLFHANQKLDINSKR